MKKILMFLIVLAFGNISLIAQQPIFPVINGWKLEVEKEVYDANNLWDIIDGAADLFLEYSFIDLHTARYTNSDSIEIKVELYCHATPVDAFGMYAQERDPSYHIIAIGAEGYLQEGVLNFLTGNYYVKMSTFGTTPKAQDALVTIGKEISSYLKQTNEFPSTLQKFPAEHKIPHTEQYVAHNFLGYAFLKSVYQASFSDSAVFKAFIIDAQSWKNAQHVIEQYSQLAPDDGRQKSPDGGCLMSDPHNGNVKLGMVRQYIFGIFPYSNTPLQNRTFNSISSNLSE